MWVAAARPLLATSRVVMIVAPELDTSRIELHKIREEVSSRIGNARVAEFHPLAAPNTASPARLVPYLRRSPDPLLQLVPLAILENVRASAPAVARATRPSCSTRSTPKRRAVTSPIGSRPTITRV